MMGPVCQQGEAARRATEWLGTRSCSPTMADGRENPTECVNPKTEGRKEGGREGRRKGAKEERRKEGGYSESQGGTGYRREKMHSRITPHTRCHQQEILDDS